MSSVEQTSELKRLSTKDNQSESSNLKKLHDSFKSFTSKNSSTSKEHKVQDQIIPEHESQIDFSLPFKEIYNIHMIEIENKTNLKRKHIYYFLFISFFFFLIGHFEIFFSYIITGYFPIKWTIQDYKENKPNFAKKWGTYWFLFIFLIFFDLQKKLVLKIIPFYFTVKTISLMILYLPGFNAAVNLYDGLFNNILQTLNKNLKNKDDNDTLVNDLKKYVKLKTE